MERVITVEATGYAEVKPDLTIVTLGVKTLLPAYEESIKLAAERYESIVEAISSPLLSKQVPVLRGLSPGHVCP